MKQSRYVSAAEFRRTREALNLSQKEAGSALGYDERTIQRWEGGDTKRIRRAMLDKLRDEAKKRGAPRAK